MMPIEKAHGIVDDREGYWKGNKVLYILPDKNLKVTWAPRQSGAYGPLVMQVVT